MSNLSVGYLFKKKYVTYQSKKWEIFEFVDYVTAISFTNTSNNERCNILSGNNAGNYASVINKNANEEDFVFTILYIYKVSYKCRFCNSLLLRCTRNQEL